MKMIKKLAVTVLATGVALSTLLGVPANGLSGDGVAYATAAPLQTDLKEKMNEIYSNLTDDERAALREAREKLWELSDATLVSDTTLWTKIHNKAPDISLSEVLDIAKYFDGIYYDEEGKNLNNMLQYLKPSLHKFAVGGGNTTLTEEQSYTAALDFMSAMETQIQTVLQETNALKAITDELAKSENKDLESVLKSVANSKFKEALDAVLQDTSVTFSAIINAYGITADDFLEIRTVFSDEIDPDRAANKAIAFAYARNHAELNSSSASNSGGTLNLALKVFGKDVPSGLVTWSISNHDSSVSLNGKTVTNSADGTTKTATVTAKVSLFDTMIYSGQVTIENEEQVVTPPVVTPPVAAPPVETPAKPTTPIFTKVVKNQKVTVTIEKDENGVEVTVVKLDKDEFKKQLTENKEAKALVIGAKSKSGKAKAVLQISDVEDAAANNQDNVFIVQADGAEYSLPAALVKSADVAAGLGISENDAINAEVNVNIEEKSDSFVNLNVINPKSKLASKVVDFSITVTNGNNSFELNDFGNTYVDRAFDLTQSVNTSKAVGVVVNADGTLSPVPTQFVEADGKKVAVLKRNSNSTYTVVENDESFTDIDNHWAEDAIFVLGNKLIVSGYEDGSFMPQGTITRGEFVTLIARSLGFDTSTTDITKFDDVTSEAWYAGALQSLVAQELIHGYSDGTFKANDQILRQDAAVIIGGVIEFLELKAENGEAKTFKDSSNISGYAADAIKEASKLSIINGYEDNSFKPKAFITRAEAVIMIKKLLENAGFISE